MTDYEEAQKRVASDPRLREYEDFLVYLDEHEDPKGWEEQWRWIIDTPVDEIVEWAKQATSRSKLFGSN